MVVNEGWEQTVSTSAAVGTDKRGRLVAQGAVYFTCPECDSEYEVEVTLPLSAGDFDAQC